jgi:hypothetical protein
MRGAVCAQIMITDQEIKRLLKDAPALRRQHLLDLVQDATKQDNTIRAKAILETLKREEQKKSWWQIYRSTRPPVEETRQRYKSRPQLALSSMTQREKYSNILLTTYQSVFDWHTPQEFSCRKL